ncbi:MAG: hypothetical protein ACYC1C_16250 [Chloroflexota bacterium]
MGEGQEQEPGGADLAGQVHSCGRAEYLAGVFFVFDFEQRRRSCCQTCPQARVDTKQRPVPQGALQCGHKCGLAMMDRGELERDLGGLDQPDAGPVADDVDGRLGERTR